MKFKAVLDDPKSLLGVLTVCRSMQRGCVIRLQSSRIRFFTTLQAAEGAQVWVACRTDHLFSDFRCDSNYKEHSITCEVLDMAQLYQVIQKTEARERRCGGRSACPRTTMRLVGNGAQPILKFSSQGDDGQLDISYDVPVRIFSDKEIEAMSAPPLEDDRMQVVVPSLPELATFIEKLRSTSCDCITFSAKSLPPPPPVHGSSMLSSSTVASGGMKRPRELSGSSAVRSKATLVAYADNMLASFSLKYDVVDLIPQQQPSDEEAEEEEDGARGVGRSSLALDGKAATVAVEMKTFARFFASIKDVMHTRASMYLVDQRALVLSVSASGGTTMVAYIPAKA